MSRVRGDTPAAAAAGFTLLEVVIVLAVIATLAGAVVPLVTAAKQAEAQTTARAELAVLAEALERYYYERGAFPSRVDAAGFYGSFALPGVDDERLRDEWGARGFYRLALTSDPDVATAYSVGENGVDDGAAAEALKVSVYGARPGGERTRARMRVITAALAAHLEAGGRITGTWSVDRAAMGLGSDYERDGFGVPFDLDGSSLRLRSYGPDRQAGTPDDIYL
ncbi:MAG: prepilin-type N-terminal cleavage/methylation domain-containing protein [Planctomycetota bacterium]